MEYFIWLKEQVRSFTAPFLNNYIFLFYLLTLSRLTYERVYFKIIPVRPVIYGVFESESKTLNKKKINQL